MITLIDGGFSQISSHVKVYVENHPLWNAQFLISHPKAVIETHKDYIKAGADIITTNTYQASINGFQEHLGLNKQECIDLIKKAVEFAKQAIDEESHSINYSGRQVKIAGSVGSYGACLHDGSEYRGEYCDTVSNEQLATWHRPRFIALAEAGIDIFGIETIPALKEALVLCDLMKEFPDKKAWISFTCKDEKHTSRGEVFKDAVEACWKRNPEQLVAVGTNCLNPIFVTPLLKSLGTHSIPIVIYPNSGETWDHDLGWCNPESRVSLMNYLPEWLNLGVRYIGGCCRTTSEDIRSFREYIDSLQQKK
ncbi:betaine-homocysteine S-methyltransferase-like [Lycorma delicatula]|uniref:betaine-homocysteine S-methyltransferase-like n=1 Tax=Lycorma delicatula TaxID=130591 RepID=UPI003F51245D